MGLAAKRRDRQILLDQAGAQRKQVDLMTACRQFAHLFKEVAFPPPRTQVVEDSDSQN
jgi:hypothetical protein